MSKTFVSMTTIIFLHGETVQKNIYHITVLSGNAPFKIIEHQQ